MKALWESTKYWWKRDPQTCVMMWCMIGIFSIIILASLWHIGATIWRALA